MTERKIRTIVVDDHPLVVAGARALIEASDDIVCVGDANNGAEAEALIEELKPDVVVLDVSLPDVNGLALAEKLLNGGFPGHIVMMTLYEERTFVQKALQIGAKGFIQKRSADQNLLLAIRSAMLGGLFLDPPTARDVMAPSAEDGTDFTHSNNELGLTEREEYVLKMVALGYANKEIAARANVSIKSIETYKARATEKLKLHSRAQIVRFAVRHGWMNLTDAGEPTIPN
ncbi:response regulator transcription factor [Rhizobiales bacterium]|uniref:response regulator n=1 Tax=Hongsoonwoonella zoysiae TaxID=2821844 RepID=UPI0015619127|nr:response regulator transcription factor [Hongsoonwoonella zoysiae]NRG18304.1 response regulator transcription factor [Hongsoonwoonella zoysiae]